eukprot:Clim_evm1s250 gene=Clim_evmTU1s250
MPSVASAMEKTDNIPQNKEVEVHEPLSSASPIAGLEAGSSGTSIKHDTVELKVDVKDSEAVGNGKDITVNPGPDHLKLQKNVSVLSNTSSQAPITPIDYDEDPFRLDRSLSANTVPPLNVKYTQETALHSATRVDSIDRAGTAAVKDTTAQDSAVKDSTVKDSTVKVPREGDSNVAVAPVGPVDVPEARSPKQTPTEPPPTSTSPQLSPKMDAFDATMRALGGSPPKVASSPLSHQAPGYDLDTAAQRDDPRVAQFMVWQYERRTVFRNTYSEAYLWSNEPHFMDIEGNRYERLGDIPAPQGFHWEGRWQIVAGDQYKDTLLSAVCQNLLTPREQVIEKSVRLSHQFDDMSDGGGTDTPPSATKSAGNSPNHTPPRRSSSGYIPSPIDEKKSVERVKSLNSKGSVEEKKKMDKLIVDEQGYQYTFGVQDAPTAAKSNQWVASKGNFYLLRRRLWCKMVVCLDDPAKMNPFVPRKGTVSSTENESDSEKPSSKPFEEPEEAPSQPSNIRLPQAVESFSKPSVANRADSVLAKEEDDFHDPVSQSDSATSVNAVQNLQREASGASEMTLTQANAHELSERVANIAMEELSSKSVPNMAPPVDVQSVGAEMDEQKDEENRPSQQKDEANRLTPTAQRAAYGAVDTAASSTPFGRARSGSTSTEEGSRPDIEEPTRPTSQKKRGSLMSMTGWLRKTSRGSSPDKKVSKTRKSLKSYASSQLEVTLEVEGEEGAGENRSNAVEKTAPVRKFDIPENATEGTFEVFENQRWFWSSYSARNLLPIDNAPYSLRWSGMGQESLNDVPLPNEDWEWVDDDWQLAEEPGIMKPTTAAKNSTTAPASEDGTSTNSGDESNASAGEQPTATSSSSGKEGLGQERWWFSFSFQYGKWYATPGPNMWVRRRLWKRRLRVKESCRETATRRSSSRPGTARPSLTTENHPQLVKALNWVSSHVHTFAVYLLLLFVMLHVYWYADVLWTSKHFILGQYGTVDPLRYAHWEAKRDDWDPDSQPAGLHEHEMRLLFRYIRQMAEQRQHGGDL